MDANFNRDIVGIYNYWYNYNAGSSYPGRSYAAYNLGAYRGQRYLAGTYGQGTGPYTFPSTNINLGMFYSTWPSVF